jgi:hypothetical protein
MMSQKGVFIGFEGKSSNVPRLLAFTVSDMTYKITTYLFK